MDQHAVPLGSDGPHGADQAAQQAVFIGRVWERWELERAMELYQKYDVFVISDEIWSDIGEAMALMALTRPPSRPFS